MIIFPNNINYFDTLKIIIFPGKAELVMKDTTKLQDSDGTKTIFLFKVTTPPKGSTNSNITTDSTSFKM